MKRETAKKFIAKFKTIAVRGLRSALHLCNTVGEHILGAALYGNC